MSLEQKVADYYTKKFQSFGAEPRGVDWNSIDSQIVRFNQLCKVIRDKRDFSVLDYGCGYGALVNYLNHHYSSFQYIGFDIAAEIIDYAKQAYKESKNIKFFFDKGNIHACDYVIASGIFNVKLDTSDNEWEKYIINTLVEINQLAIKGFSFNILTIYSDKEYMRSDLYYADPLFFFDFCKKNFSKNVALLHDYDLYEFTIIVRR